MTDPIDQAPTAWHAAALVLVGYAAVALLTGSDPTFPLACTAAALVCLGIDGALRRRRTAEA